MRPSTAQIIQFLLAAVVVVALGGLAGWYFFVNKHIEQTQSTDDARGFGQSASFAQGIGSTYQNIVDGITGAFGASSPTNNTEGAPAPRIWHVSKNPVAGMGFAASSTDLYFAERSTGNILLATPRTSLVQRLSNTLLPKVYEAQFAESGAAILRRIADDGSIITFAGTLATSSAQQETAGENAPSALNGTYLAQNILAIGSDTDGKGITYLVKNPAGGSVAATASWTGSSQKKLFESPLENWRLYVLRDGRMYIAQKASDDIPGSAFKVATDGSLSTLVSSMPGLTILPRASSTALIYGQSSGGTLALFARVSEDAATVRLPIRTTADKCVWAPGMDLIAYCAVPQSAGSDAFLRDWYRGALHTADSWWSVNVSAGTAEQIYVPTEDSLDVHQPTIDGGGEYIAFINGLDQSLWMLRIAK